nr:hypothetical protein Itr_chr07CG04950 [Ipomoea trifida]
MESIAAAAKPSLPPDSLRLRLPLLLAATAGDAGGRDSDDDAASHHSTTPPATLPFDVQDFRTGMRGWGIGVADGNMPFLAL